MAPAETIASLRRDIACDYLQCVSSTTKFGVAMCIICVTLGSAFAYYWAFIRGRRQRDIDNQLSSPFRLSTVANRFDLNLPSLGQHSPDPEAPAIVHRPAPAAPEPPAVVPQQVPYDLWTAPPMYSSHLFIPGPPPFPPPYTIYQQPVFVPAQAAVVVPPPPPLVPTAPSTILSESPPIANDGPSQHDDRQLVVQLRQPSPGYASTITDSNSARGQSNPPVGRQTPTDALSRNRSRSSSLSIQSHTQHGQLVVHSGINETVIERRVHFPETPTGMHRSAHRRHHSENAGREDQSRIGRPRFQSVGEPRPATYGVMDDVFGVGDSGVGRKHQTKSRSRRRSSRNRPFTALLSGGESSIGRQDQGRGNVGKGDLPGGRRPSVGESFRTRDPSVGRQERGLSTPRGRRLGPPPTSRGRSRGPSPSKSGVSSTGAICSFEGSNKDQPPSSPASSSQRYRGTASSRSLSTERGLSRPRRILDIPENPPSPSLQSTDSQDLYLASVEDNTEDDGDECHPHRH